MILAIAGWSLVTPLNAQTLEPIVLAWDPNPETNISEYRLHIGRSPRTYDLTVPVGLVTTFTVADLAPGVTYYFALTAVNTDGLESEHSEEVEFGTMTVDGTLSFQQRTSDFRVIFNGNPGTTYSIEASPDLQNWTVFTTRTSDSSGVLTIGGHRSQQLPSQFFRAVKVP